MVVPEDFNVILACGQHKGSLRKGSGTPKTKKWIAMGAKLLAGYT